jgi:uncharacterized protein HemX
VVAGRKAVLAAWLILAALGACAGWIGVHVWLTRRAEAREQQREAERIRREADRVERENEALERAIEQR